MAGFGGFGNNAFGSTNNNNNATNNTNNSSPFGGFGQTTSAFGGGTAFGSGATTGGGGGGLFGNNANQNTTTQGFGGFGSSTNNNTSSPFGGNKPAFGATTTGGSLFGGTTATSNNTFGGTGFGASTGGFGNTPNTGFGTSTGGGGLFGGSTTSTAFGSGAGTTAGFSNTASPFTSNQQNNGTGTTQYTPLTEKEPNSTNTNQYQTITAMPAYQKFSTEELRFTDYAQGRKFGNGSGQAGAFGNSTGFGGFGANNNANAGGFGATTNTAGGGIFGSTNNNNNNNTTTTSTPFGGTSNTTGFGTTNTAGGLFGAKPAATGLFGNTTTTSAPAAGGLFGTSGGTGFGGNTTNTGFGAANTNTGFGTSQNKPLFGAAPNANPGFGNTNASTGGGLFGGGNATGGFGNNQANNATAGFGFGAQNNTQQPQASGGVFGSFGNANNQQKPGGLFGNSTNTGGGLFGNNQNQQQQPGGLFGNNTAQQSTGLFGAAKPATGGLFGSSTTNTGGGLFGNAPQQQNTGTGLFGSTNNAASTGLFGNKPAATTGGLGTSLFGANASQAANTGGSSLFGNSQQPQQTGLGGSLFGSTMQPSTQQNQQNHLVASLNDNPYGNAQLFQSLQTPTQSLGPIATPLSSTQRTKKQAIIPHYRVVPHASSRLITPQRRPQAYGFSYSNYNSPLSPGSNVSPLGLGNSLLGGSSFGRSLGKSLSTSNLRHSFTAQESILAPGAFSSQSRSGPGSMKKLNINRNLGPRRSLFSTESPTITKRVSFDTSPAPSTGTLSLSGALHNSSSQTNGAADGNVSPTTGTNGAPNGASHSLALTVVPENSPSPETQALETRNRKSRLLREDQAPGNYSTEPSIEAIAKMPREERAHVKKFTVRREGVGQIVFSEVDLTNIPLEQICGHIVELSTRQATVYGDRSSIKTPPRGHGLNVTSLITLENSWPRVRSGKLKVIERSSAAFEKHIRVLQACKDTKFISYDEVTGSWTFQVEHYTTYGHIYDDDDSVMTTTISHESESPADMKSGTNKEPETVTPELPQIGSDTSSQSGVEDTFDFKKGKRKQVPGQYDDVALEDAEFYDDETEDTSGALSFDGPREVVIAVGTEEDLEDDPYDQPLDEMDDWQVAGSATGAAESSANDAELSAPQQNPTPPRTKQLFLGADWTEHLQQTISPVKRDRHQIAQPESKNPTTSNKAANDSSKHVTFGSTMDIMKSLFGQSGSQEKVHFNEVRA